MFCTKHDACIKGKNMEIMGSKSGIKGLSLQECQLRCLITDGCKSIDYKKQHKSLCFLSSWDRESAGSDFTKPCHKTKNNHKNNKPWYYSEVDTKQMCV